MRDIWYGDKRDLVKWSGILHLCNLKGIKNVFQVSYYRKEAWPSIDFENDAVSIQPEVIKHFRNIEDILRLAKRVGITITVYKEEFKHSEREHYHQELCRELKDIDEQKIIFLDPDTGLAPKKCEVKHVKPQEVKSIWDSMNPHDVLVFYQHRFWPKNGSWKEIRKDQLASSCGLDKDRVKMWSANDIASDVVFYFIEKMPYQ